MKWPEWLLGTCEGSPRSSLGDKGRLRLAGVYFVHMIHFTRTQAPDEWRISTRFHLIETSDSKQTNRANWLEYEIKDSLSPFVVLQVTFTLNGKLCRQTHKCHVIASGWPEKVGLHVGNAKQIVSLLQNLPSLPRRWCLQLTVKRRFSLPLNSLPSNLGF